MKALDPRVTFSELAEWPDDGRRYELYDGEVIVVPSPIPRHQLVALKLTEVLLEYQRTTGGLVLHAPLDIVFSEHDVLQPDLVYFRQERVHLIDMMTAIHVPPDLAVEILSRSTEVRDRGRKMQTYARFGVPEYWIVDPIGNTLEIFRLDGGAYAIHARSARAGQLASATLPGLTLTTSRIFDA